MTPSIRLTSSVFAAGLRLAWVTATLACVGASLSCAAERPAINRVQASALGKDFFIGELSDPSDDPVFFWRNFVVDASESQELVGISSNSGLERVRFDISENMLFARRAYSVTGGDNKGESLEPNGDIIAAYRIESHFDIRRAYSSATGEEINVVEENTSDRPWHEREYFRVDWSENLVDSPVWDDMFFGRIFGGLEVTPISYYVSDPDSPDAPHFVPEEGYFDITSHFSVAPETVRLWGKDVPLCFLMGWFTGSAIHSCEAQEAVVRSSFWRVDHADPDDDFEPFENTGAPRQIFGNPGGLGESGSLGIVTPPREQYDPGYGFTDDGLQRFMNIHDIWRQSHQTIGECSSDDDCERTTGRSGSRCLASGTCTVPCNHEARADTDGGGNGTDDQCENDDTDYAGSGGAQCSARDRCTIPYRDREVAPVAYFVNPEMPDDLQDSVKANGDFAARGPTEDTIYTWNQVLQLAVARAREVECRRTARQGAPEAIRESCHARYFVTDETGRDAIQMVSHGGWGIELPKDETDVLVTCHNPVREYDPEVCGEPGARSRVGDLRKHFLIYWPYHTQAPYGGIGNWRADPLTGQIIGAAATTIGRSTTLSAAQTRDLALVALGELDLEDITEGVAAARFQRDLREGRKPVGLSQEELERRVALAAPGLGTSQAEPEAMAALLGTKHPKAVLRSLLEQKRDLSVRPDLAMDAALRVRAAAEPLLGTELELDLANSHWLVDAAGLDPNTGMSDEVLERVSPLRGQDFGLLTAMSSQLQGALGARGVCHLDPGAPVGNPDIYGIGRHYRDKYPELAGRDFAEAVYEDLWKETYKGIQLHELGHSLGLLHNFTSSYDSMNFNPQYWQLRTQEGTSVASCGGVPRGASDTCMGPRFLDPETDDELGQGSESRPGINYYAHTSTMEYQNSRFFESIGLGQYDVMAMGALYGRVLQTFDASSVPQAEQRFLEANLESQLGDDWLGRWSPSLSPPFTFLVHYTELARQIQVFDPGRCRSASASERKHAEWRIVHGKVCTPPPKDYGHWDDFADQALDMDGEPIVARKVRVEGSNRPAAGNARWPYRYGADISNSYPHVNPEDSGADLWELTRETIAKTDYQYPLNYFRRHRRGWDDGRLPSYTAWSFYERLRSYHWSASFTRTLLEEIFDEETKEFAFSNENLWLTSILAQTDMFQGIADMLLRPEPGEYAVELNGNGVADLFDGQEGDTFVIDPGDGRFMAPAFDSSPTAGGSWDYPTYVSRAGFSVEKQLAARVLTDGRPVLFSVSRDIYLDSRNVNINFRANLPAALDRLLGGALSEDWAATAPVVSRPASGGVASVRYRDFTLDTGTLAANDVPTFPNIGYNQQIALLIYPQLFGRINGDLTLANKLRVWLDGSISGELEVPEAEQVRFSDPESGITYIARTFGTEVFEGQTIDKGIASRMLQRANQLLQLAYVQATDEAGEPLFDEFGRPVLALDADGLPVKADDPAAHRQFRKYVGLVDVAVQVSTIFGHGPL